MQEEKRIQAAHSTDTATNETLAVRYQQGDKAALGALWERNTGILNKLSYGYFIRNQALCIRCGVMLEDIRQESFFAVEMAARAYSSKKGYRFTTYLHHHAQTCFNDLCGMRTNHGRQEPLSHASSLNVLVGEEELESGELVPDPNSSYAFDCIEDAMFYKQLQKAVEAALGQLDERSANVIRSRFYEGKRLREVAAEQAISRERARQLEEKALRSMRGGDSLRELRPFVPYMYSWAYQSTGFTPWKYRGSVEERIIEKLQPTPKI